MLQKTNVNINFSQGLDTKTDPKQVQIGKFLSLANSIFTKGGLLQKRNGYQALLSATTAGTPAASYLTTFNGNLTAIGNSINAYSQSSKSFVSKGSIQPMELATMPLIRNNINQTQCDSAIASNGLICTVYSETNGASTDYRYVVADATTGQNIIAPSALPTLAGGTITGSSRVFIVGSYFVIVSQVQVTGTTYLQYCSMPITNVSLISHAQNTYAEAYVPISSNPGWDGVVTNNTLVIAYNTTAGGQGVHVTSLTAAQIASNQASSVVHAFTNAAYKASLLSLCVDATENPNIVYISFWNSTSTNSYTAAVYLGFGTITTQFAPQEMTVTQPVANITSAAQSGVCTVFEEITNAYSYDAGIPTNYIVSVTCNQTGTVGMSSPAIVRSVGLASKAFIVNQVIYFLASYQSSYQPSYFLINGSTTTAANPVVAGKLAYENGGGYLTLGLPNVTISNGNVAQIPYLYKDLVEALSTTANSQQTTTGGIYSQTGINLATFTIGTSGLDSAEIGNDLHVSGGFLWMYDGYLPVEHNFFLWPDNVEATWSASGGSMQAQPDNMTNTNAYYYQALYSWADNQGNIFRSAPSIPIAVTTTGSAATGSVTVKIPTLRLTYKTLNPVKIELYRWSVAHQTYYQVTSISSPTLNSTTVDSISYVDTLADSSIVGNNIIYTTGGVIEDINAPASNLITLFDTRLWLVDAEDPNLLWFSKQVIEATPVEMSDLLTFYVAPTTAAQGSTGPITAIAPMDDKLIIFKRNAIYYINGTGPDNTGANNNYSQPIFITSTVGCANQASIIFTPSGLMFQSDKGIWLLGRGLETQYIGAPVEAFNSAMVQSAVNIPETTQVRFTLSTGATLMYDYYYQQWGTFIGIPAVSACIFENLHTFLNEFGQVYQENPGSYVDGSNPVLMSFTTGWLNMAGVQGYMRSYWFFLLAQYLSPHKLQVEVAYDYNPSPEQSTLISPTNFSPAYGGSSPYGQNAYGGSGDLENWRVFLAKQRCSAFQVSVQEVYDSTFGVAPGAGFTMSGLNLVYAIKKGWRTISAAHSAG